MNGTFVMDSVSHTVVTHYYRTAIATGCRHSTRTLSSLCFADLTQLSVGSGRYRSRFRNNGRGFTSSAIPTAHFADRPRLLHE
jgi:hypothetical protein